MPLFGAHMSIAGGLHKAVEAAAALGMDTLQLFTGNPSAWPFKPRPAERTVSQSAALLTKNASQWEGKPLRDDEIRTFQRAVADAGLRFPTAHDSYLINLAAPDDGLYRKSIDALAKEMRRAEALGLSYLVTHPGAHTGGGENAGLARIVAALDEVHSRCAGFAVTLLLENTAGQGTSLGYRFEQLAAILDRVQNADWLGVCFDTCHAFAAGYPLASAADYPATFEAFDAAVGLARLKLVHVNDSVKPLGSRVDRHAHIGRGQIGLDAFRRLVTDPRFAALPMVLETPKEDDDGTAMDPVNLVVLRGFLAPGAAALAG
jgi:deoxyribonuclease IV